MMRVAQASAAFDGRDYLVPDDVKRAIPPVLRHRIMLKPEAELEGFDADRVPHRRGRRGAGAAHNDRAISSVPADSRRVRAASRWGFGLTPRSIALLIAGFFFLIPGFWDQRLSYAMLAWEVLVLLGAWLDGMRLPSAAQLVAAPTWSNTPALDSETEIELTIENNGSSSSSAG